MTKNQVEKALITGLFTIAVIVFVFANSASKMLDTRMVAPVVKKNVIFK